MRTFVNKTLSNVQYRIRIHILRRASFRRYTARRIRCDRRRLHLYRHRRGRVARDLYRHARGECSFPARRLVALRIGMQVSAGKSERRGCHGCSTRGLAAEPVAAARCYGRVGRGVHARLPRYLEALGRGSGRRRYDIVRGRHCGQRRGAGALPGWVCQTSLGRRAGRCDMRYRPSGRIGRRP